MEATFKLMKNFEEINNISIALHAYSDRSLAIVEFWNEEVLYETNDVNELHEFLKTTKYKLDSMGRCYDPVILLGA